MQMKSFTASKLAQQALVAGKKAAKEMIYKLSISKQMKLLNLCITFDARVKTRVLYAIFQLRQISDYMDHLRLTEFFHRFGETQVINRPGIFM